MRHKNIEEGGESNRSVIKKIARREMVDKTGKCGFCPLHRGENAVKQPHDDRNKNHRR